jgi:DNA-binding CsgD family transcriptional regulator
MFSLEHELPGLGDLLDEFDFQQVRAEVERVVDAVWPEIKAYVLDGRPMRTATLPAITAAAGGVVAAGVPVAALVGFTRQLTALAVEELGQADIEAARRAVLVTHDITFAVLSVEHRAPAVTPPPIDPLEHEILVMAARGLSTAEIADAIFYSRQAVSYHLGRLMARFGTPNRTALVAFGYEQGLLARVPIATAGSA